MKELFAYLKNPTTTKNMTAKQIFYFEFLIGFFGGVVGAAAYLIQECFLN